MSDTHKSVKSVVPEKEKVHIPLFNVVDDWDATQEKLGKVVAEVWGIKYGFLNSTMTSLIQSFAKVILCSLPVPLRRAIIDNRPTFLTWSKTSMKW